MKTITPAQRELIDAITVDVNVSPSLLEKDIHVTDVLHTLFKLEFAHSRFVFCGGTSLSKAFGVIERMSEDVDLKIVMNPDHGLSRSATKNYLRDVNKCVKEAMATLGFVEDATGANVKNEYRYSASSWLYQSVYESSTALRPHLSLEFTVRDPKFVTTAVTVSYLIEKLGAPASSGHTIECIAIEETLAEKALSFLRRHSMHRAGAMTQAWDEALVRHIYDIHCILTLDPTVTEKASVHFAALVDFDRIEFKGYEAFLNDAKACLASALHTAENEEQTIREYNLRLLPLIYGNVRPEFRVAFSTFKDASNILISKL